MRRLLTAAAVVCTLLLGVIAWELYRIDYALSWMRPVSTMVAAPVTNETREQRVERVSREASENAAFIGDVILRTVRRMPSAKPATEPSAHPR
jgi:hypothetical protein